METINLAQLTPEQIKQIMSQARVQRVAASGKPADRNAVIDAMLQARDGDNWKHTTADILDALIAKSIVSATADRPAELKRIQTRKQLLVKKPGNETKYGYIKTPFGFTLTAERVIAWLAEASDEDKKTVRKALK